MYINMLFLFLSITILQQCDKILNEKRSDTRELAEQNTEYDRMGAESFCIINEVVFYIDSGHTIASL